MIFLISFSLLLSTDKIDYKKLWEARHFKLAKMIEFATPYNHSKDQKGYVVVTFEIDKEIENKRGFVTFYDGTIASIEEYYEDGKKPAKTKKVKIQIVDWPLGWYDKSGKFPTALIKSIKSKMPVVVSYDLVKQ